jgi:hypothetical protein
MRFWGSSVSRPSGGGHEEPQVSPYTAAPFEAVGIFQGEHEGKSRERPDPLDLAQEPGFGVALPGDPLQLSVVFADALGERADLLQDGSEGRQKRLRDVLRGVLVEAPRRALGQAGPEGLDCPADVVDQLRAAIYQRLPGADDCHVGLGVLAPVLEWVQELRVHSSQARARFSASTSSVLRLLA